MACRAALATGRSLTGGGSDKRESHTGHPCPVIESLVGGSGLGGDSGLDGGSGLGRGKWVSEETVASEEASGLRGGKWASEEAVGLGGGSYGPRRR